MSDRHSSASPAATHTVGQSTAPWAVRWLRVEGAALLVLAATAWSQLPDAPHAWVFAATFLLPDLGMLAYLDGPSRGGLAYNLAHSTILPAILLTTATLLWQPTLIAMALVWFSHIGFDRMLGYGLKSRRAFNDTHLGAIGRRRD